MAESAGPSPGRIFISYRQGETAYAAGWLFDRLAVRFGRQVFKDVDSIEPGENWVEVITRVVGSCDALLALIGNEWLTITDNDGRRRLDDPDDFVRLEIEAAQTRNVRVIPILVAGARMPRAAELPSSLAGLTQRQALVLNPANFDTSPLLRVLDKVLAEVRTPDDAAAISAPAERTPDRSATELPVAAERPEQAESSPIPSVQPAAPATHQEMRDDLQVSEPNPDTNEAGPSPDEGQPRDKPRYRLSRRAWMILAGAGVALLLLSGIIVSIDDVTGATVVCGSTTYTVTSGSLLSVIHEGTAASGNKNVTGTSALLNAVAMDTAGNVYSLRGTFEFGGALNAQQGGGVFTNTVKLQIISSGSGTVDNVNVTLHVTEINGDVTDFNFGTCEEPE